MCAMRFTALLLSFTIVSTGAGQTVETQIRAEVARYVAAVNSGDSRTLTALYVNNPTTASVNDGEIHRGWQRISETIREAYSQAGTIRMTIDSVNVVRLGSDAAIAVMRYRWMLGRAEDRRITGAMTLVYARTRRGWRVAHDHTSTLESSGSAAASLAVVTDSGPTSPRRETQSCTVTRIVDGDTIECARTGRVRLIGMDTPESNQPPFGAQASGALAALIPVGMEVQVEQDVDARDQYGRLLAYVWVGRTMVNWRMVREGWAVLLTYQPNVQYVDWFIDAERRARDEGRGLWASGGFDCRPADHRRNRCE
jgi:micrococcal nuclease